jgi:hypothetical protein
MGFSSIDLNAIPVQPLVDRRLRLGPFASGRDLVRFLGIAAAGAVVAALSSALVWLPFLAVGTLVAFARFEGQTLDDYAVGYCRFRYRASAGSARPIARAGRSGERSRSNSSIGSAAGRIRAGGIPIAFLPPTELERLFGEWRSTLASFDRPIGFRMRGERFSPLPFMPAAGSWNGPEGEVLESYRGLVRELLRHRYRRVVDLSVWESPAERNESSRARESRLDDLVAGLTRMGIPAWKVSAPRRPAPGPSGRAL